MTVSSHVWLGGCATGPVRRHCRSLAHRQRGPRCRVPNTATHVACRTRALPSTLAPVRRPRILVADDEPSIRALLVRLLGPTHDVVTVADGSQALALFRSGAQFDVVLCDLTMPNVGGALVYFEVSLLQPAQAEKFVFMHGGATSEGDRALLAGLDQPRLEKPFSITQLDAVISTMLAASAN
jgi:CheY-like chemotaxis protein